MRPLHMRKRTLPLASGGAILVIAALLSAGASAGSSDAFVRSHEDPSIQWGPCPAFMPESCGLAVLQGEADEKHADVLFRLRSGTTAPEHWHTSAERMVLLAGKMRVDYAGQEPVVLETGDYAYGPPELPHDTTCESETDCVLFIAFIEPVDAFAAEE